MTGGLDQGITAQCDRHLVPWGSGPKAHHAICLGLVAGARGQHITKSCHGGSATGVLYSVLGGGGGDGRSGPQAYHRSYVCDVSYTSSSPSFSSPFLLLAALFVLLLLLATFSSRLILRLLASVVLLLPGSSSSSSSSLSAQLVTSVAASS